MSIFSKIAVTDEERAAKAKEVMKAIASFSNSQNKQEYLYSYVPRAGIAQIKEHGLLSGNELAKPENRHLLELARPNGDADRRLKEKDERLANAPGKVLVKVKLDSNGKSLLHRYLTTKEWGYPGGKAEPDEEMEDAAVRELKELTGYHIDKSKLKYDGVKDKHHQFSGKLEDVSKIEPAFYETGNPRELYWGDGEHKEPSEDDWIDNNSLSKLAAAYTASGEKVQGVGLRKMYHSLLEEQGLPGLAVNNEETGDVELSFDGDEAKRKEIFDQLSSRVKAKTGHPITFTPTANPQVSVPINLSNIDAEKLNAIHHLAYRMSNLYNPNDSAMDSNNSFKEKIADRFRLQVNQRGLQGTVPSRASEQLSGNRPMYDFMLPDQRTRSEEEALSDMPKDQKRRLMKALLGGRGFLDPNQTKVAEAQPRHELVIGASGVGKTTKAKELSEQNGMPVINFIKDNDNLRNENNRLFATAFYDKIQPAIKKWEKVDSKLKNRINPTLVTQINNKVAALLSSL